MCHFPRPSRMRRCVWIIGIGLLGLGGCGSLHSTERAQRYENLEWFQSGSNRIANLGLRDNLESVRKVQFTLYRRNPREWRKCCASMDEAIERTWNAIMQGPPLPELGGATGIDAVRMAFDTKPQGFQGDRVAALVVGWAALLKQTNGNTWQQTILDGTDAENSYRAARNFEISLWLIGSKTGIDGQPLLLASEIGAHERNLIVDRELSKIIARLDLLAAQADEKYRRAAIDFGQGWLTGNVAPFLMMVPN